MSAAEAASTVIVALIGAGLLNFIKDGIKAWRAGRAATTPEARASYTLTTVDDSLAIVSKARDELEADNARLRKQQTEDDSRHEADRGRWERKERTYLAEIEALEQKVRGVLIELTSLKDRHIAEAAPGGTP